MANNDNQNNVLKFTGLNYGDIPPDQILEANKGKFESCILVGWDKDGGLQFASSDPDKRHVLYMLEKAKMFIMEEDS